MPFGLSLLYLGHPNWQSATPLFFFLSSLIFQPLTRESKGGNHLRFPLLRIGRLDKPGCTLQFESSNKHQDILHLKPSNPPPLWQSGKHTLFCTPADALGGTANYTAGVVDVGRSHLPATAFTEPGAYYHSGGRIVLYTEVVRIVYKDFKEISIPALYCRESPALLLF